MKQKYVRSCGIAAMLLAKPAFAQTRIVLDDADSGRVFEGIGAISQGGTSRNMVDYPDQQKSEILDYMFKPKFGANLQHFKVEIGGGENGTSGSEPTHALTREELADPKPRGFEFWLMAEARKRNPQVLLDCLPWSYPKNYIRGRITKTEVWCMLSGIYPGIGYSGVGLMEAQTPWSGYYEVWPATWTTAHTTQFADPGWRYMDQACAKIDPATWGGSYVTLRNPKTGDWSMIVCADKPVTLDVQVAGKLARGDVHVWKSNEKTQFVEEKPLRLTNSAFNLSLEGNSVYTLSTTTGQKKGAHPAPPPAADFPLPYKEDFESYPAGVIPKYLSDQKGSFEAARRADGKGMCLKQIVPKEGIAWGGPGGVPNTVFCDKLWTDYTIQADVLVTGGKMGIGGRYLYGQFLGWDFVLQQDGSWSVHAPHVANGQESVKSLATGKITDFTPGQWHHLAVSLKGEDMLVTVDGKEVTRVKYEGYANRKSGMAYLLSSYDPNCFDNLSVTP